MGCLYLPVVRLASSANHRLQLSGAARTIPERIIAFLDSGLL